MAKIPQNTKIDDRYEPSRRTLGAVLSVGGEVVGLLVQLLLVYIGIEFFLSLRDELNVILLLAWCLIATLYLALSVLGLNIVVRLGTSEPMIARAVLAHPVVRLLSMIVTFSASALGFREAFVLILNIGQQQVDSLVEFSAIWTMLLSWAMFHWGYARIYYSRYYRAETPPLRFPDTDDPKLSDFVYFSYTNATAFSVSDVQVTSSRMRWTVVWHTCFAFFFNALIIVLSMNVISKGDLFANLLS